MAEANSDSFPQDLVSVLLDKQRWVNWWDVRTCFSLKQIFRAVTSFACLAPRTMAYPYSAKNSGGIPLLTLKLCI